MKAIAGIYIGARRNVLGTFYEHAVRPIVDYASGALITAKTKLREKLEAVQNEAAKIILGAPRWKKVINHRGKPPAPGQPN